MGVEIWKLISYVPFGRDVKGVFACRVCGYTTTYIGKGKAPSYSCPKCANEFVNWLNNEDKIVTDLIDDSRR